MGGMHIDEHHAVGGLRQDIDAMKLCDRIAQGRGGIVSGRAVQRALRRRLIPNLCGRGAQVGAVGIGGSAIRCFRQGKMRLAWRGGEV